MNRRNCTHPVVELSQPFIGSWCETPRYRCFCCKKTINNKTTILQKGTRFVSSYKVPRAKLKKMGTINNLSDDDLVQNVENTEFP